MRLRIDGKTCWETDQAQKAVNKLEAQLKAKTDKVEGLEKEIETRATINEDVIKELEKEVKAKTEVLEKIKATNVATVQGSRRMQITKHRSTLIRIYSIVESALTSPKPKCKTCGGSQRVWWDKVDGEIVTLQDACQMPDNDVENITCPDCKENKDG